jgi:ankyrin repeat protein
MPDRPDRFAGLSPLDAALAKATHHGDLDAVRTLLAGGADARYRRPSGYDALIDAAYGADETILELLALLLAAGTELTGRSDHGETALNTLSRNGRFDAVRLLLDAGADGSQLRWTPLMEAVALGTPADVAAELALRPPLEARDHAARTAWLIAALTGDVAKATLLRDAGADVNACGRCGHPPLSYAIQGRHPEMMRFLIGEGADVNQPDEFGDTPLMEAAGSEDLACVEILLAAGADVGATADDSALRRAGSRAVVLRLLAADADPAKLSSEGRRALVGLSESTDVALADVSEEEFRRVRTRRFGAGNPESMDFPFWRAMVRSGDTAFVPRQRYENGNYDFRTPVWCAHRYGQSLTLLPDGRAVQIGGEHEDSYDPDFCIYNDVFVHEADGSFRIYGYPENVFPPTDFHTATLVGRWIYVIGSLGYYGSRLFGQTPVYRLNVETLQIESCECGGEAPGWIFKHRAWAVGNDAIRVRGGTIVSAGEQESHDENKESFVLDLRGRTWRREEGGPT